MSRTVALKSSFSSANQKLRNQLVKLLFLLFSTISFQIVIAQTSTFNGTGGSISNKGGVIIDSFPVTVSNIGAINGTTFGLTSVSLNLSMAIDSIEEIYIKSSVTATDSVYLYLRPIDRTVNGVLANNNFNATFINTSLNPIWTALPPFTGNFIPDGMMGLLNDGRVADGTWKLYVKTNNPTTGGKSGGIINSWSITFSNSPAANIVINKNSSAPSKLCDQAPLICNFDGYPGITNNGLNISPVLKKKIENDANCSGIIHNNSFIKFVAGATSVSFELYVYNSRYNKQGIQMWIVDGTAVCGSTGKVSMYPDVSGSTCNLGLDGVNVGYVTPTTYKANGLKINNTYYIVFDGALDDYCDFIIKPTPGSSSVQPSISLTPKDAIVCEGQSVTLNATINSGTTTWTANPSTALSSTSGNTVTFNTSVSNTPSSTTPYLVTATLSGATVGTCPASAQSNITVVTSPSFTTQPDVTSYTYPGQTFPPLSVSVTPATGIYYQWYVKQANTRGVAISGATNSTFTPPNTTIGTFYYYCVITNNTCTDASNPSGAYIVKIPPGTCTTPDAIEFIQQPDSVAQGTVMTPAVTVRAYCSATGTTATGYTGKVTITAKNGCGLFTNFEDAVNGIATFDTIKFSRSVQNGVSLVASAATIAGKITSDTFSVTAPTATTGGTVTKTIASNDFETSQSNKWSYVAGTPTYPDEDYFGIICNSGNCYLSKTTKQPVTYNVTKWANKSITLTSSPTDLFVGMSILEVDGSTYTGGKSTITNIAGNVITVDTKITGSTPSNVTFAWVNSSGTMEDENSLTFNTISNLSKYKNLTFKFKVASLNDAGSVNKTDSKDGGAAGVDNTEDLIIETSSDGGSTWDPLLTYTGASNLLFPISNTLNPLIYQSNSTFAPGSGLQSSAPSSFYVTIPDGTAQFQFRITGTDNRFSENWVVDDVSLTGDTTTLPSTGVSSPLPALTVSGSTTICPGTTATLSSVSSNTIGTVNYAWSPATALQNATIAAPQTQTLSKAQSYILTITDGDGCTATAGPVNISIFSKPILNSQPTPKEVDVCLNGFVDTIKIDATGSESYQWYENSTKSTTGGTKILANGNSDFYIPPTDIAGTYYYYCVIGSNCATLHDTTNVFGPYVVNPLPVVSIIASNNPVCPGSSTTLTASGADTYNWISGPNNSSTYTVSPTTATNYIVTGTFTATGCSKNDTITITTSNTATASVSIAADKTGSICAGTSVTFTATPSNGGTAPTYQWNKNGTSINGATSSTYTYKPSGQDQITCTMTSNSTCVTTATVTSTAILESVTNNVTPDVTIAVNPTGSICAGTSVTFTATPASGGTAPTYQWNKNGLSISGATTTTYTYAPDNNDAITCTITANNTCQTVNTATSTSITETVTANVTPSVTIAVNPTGSICAGTSVTFTATPASGGTTPTYQWNKNGVSISGATSATYTYTPDINEAITCTIKTNNTCQTVNTATSASITETITPGNIVPKVVIAANTSLPICTGASVGFTASSTNGGSAPTYEWDINSKPISLTGNTFQFNSFNNNDTVICVLKSNASCLAKDTAHSLPLIMKVNTKPVVAAITTTGTNPICPLKTIQLNNDSTGGTWSSGSTSVATVDPKTGLVTGVNKGSATISYSITNSCGVTPRSYIVNVSPNIVVANITAKDTFVCKSNTIQLSDATKGGIWSSSKSSIASVGKNSGLVDGLSIGQTTIYYTVTGNCVLDTPSYAIKVVGETPKVSYDSTRPTCLYPSIGSITVKSVQGNEGPYLGNYNGSTYSIPFKLSNLTAGTYSIYFTNKFDCIVDSTTLQYFKLPLLDDGNCDTLYVPNSYVPGYRNVYGQTQYYKPLGGSTAQIKTIHFRMFNRFGNLIFESRDLNSGWNGTFNGIEQATGTYVWYLDYTLIHGDGKPIVRNGTCVLIR